MLHPHFLNKKMNSFNNMFKAACGQLRPPYLRPRSFETCWFATHSFETCWVETRSYETTFMWDLFTWDHFHLGAVGWRRRSVETTFIWDLLSWDLFIGDHIHVRLVFSCDHFNQHKKTFSSFLVFHFSVKNWNYCSDEGNRQKHKTWIFDLVQQNDISDVLCSKARGMKSFLTSVVCWSASVTTDMEGCNFRSPAKKWKVDHKNVIHSKSKQLHFNLA